MTCIVALATAGAAPTKEGAHARLTTIVALDAAPGSTVTVGWTVTVPGENGERTPFAAVNMFVRLLSKTGAASTIGFSPQQGMTGRYVARLKVPRGGIGGIRAGLRGTTDVFFPIANSPFRTTNGVTCDVAALRGTLTAFVRAYNGGDFRRLDRLFSRENFVWYSSSGPPGERVRREALRRGTLIAYFRRRHRQGDRLALTRLRFNSYERERNLGHFELGARRRADDFRNGEWFEIVGKGALDCSSAPVTIAVLSIGSASR